MNRTDKFILELQKLNPSFKVKFKDKSRFMKLLSYLLFFNKSFMSSFTTTIGNTIYSPSEKALDNKGSWALVTLSHEYCHMVDNKRFLTAVASFLYLTPQILSPLMWLFTFYHWGLGLAFFLLFLLPIPSPFRAYYELRGYSTSLFVVNELLKERNASLEIRSEVLYNSCSKYNKNFIDSGYYFMWPFGVKEKLHKICDKILAEEISDNTVFVQIKKAIENSKL